MALILNIDSSLETATVSIAQDGIILQHEVNNVQKQHASFLHSAVQKLTNDLKISLQEVDAVACTIGPGSYTGLRVALAAAKGFCYALNVPLITIGTLEAMAFSIQILHPEKDVYYCPMIDARRMEVYTALYNQDLVELHPAHAIIIDEQFYAEELRNNKKILFFGNGMEKYKNMAKPTNAMFVQLEDICNSINMLSHKKFVENIFATLSRAVPLYAKEFYNGV